MKIVFVGSGNRKQGEVLPIVQAQADSLLREGIDLIIYPVVGSGLVGYLKNVFSLAKMIRREKPNVVHAHYSLCGYIARLATTRPIVVSIMGSFPTNSRKRKFVKWCIRNAWNTTIVKSKRTEEQLAEKGLYVIPNGVNLELFGTIEKSEARKRCGFDPKKQYVIFVSNPQRSEKRYDLAQKAVELLGNNNVELIPVYNQPHYKIAEYMIAADALILTSIQEGSPNVVKEAMASNCPVVATNVGDVKWLLDGVTGSYVANTFEAEEVAALLKRVLTDKSSNGRERLIEIGLDSKTVANKLIQIYEQTCQN